MINGIINVYKERGYTSHDVVAKLRGILRQKKIGHTGTLDPEAQGVLPVCLGNATKVCDLLTDRTKEYRAVLRLGTVTDTQDLTGTVLETHEPSCTEEEVRDCIEGFVGTQEQIPPMYSALKVNGKKLYELARQGVEVERKARTITVSEIRIHEIRLPEAEFTVVCSKGTYIRTLCHDIGARLGCGGCMKSLLRTKVGPFCLEDSLRLDEIAELRDAGELSRAVQPTDSVFAHLPQLVLTPEAERLVRNGNPLHEELLQEEEQPARNGNALHEGLLREAEGVRREDGSQVRVYAPDGTFLAVYRWDARRAMYRAEKMFL